MVTVGSCPYRRRDAVAELAGLQADYQVWLGTLPPNSMANALRWSAIFEFTTMLRGAIVSSYGPTAGSAGQMKDTMPDSNRDTRFPPHEDIVEMILGSGYVGTYTAEELHDDLAGVAELRPELLEVMGGNRQTRWTNYIAHGLRALTIDGSHKKIDGVYHQTERGRIVAKRMLGDWEPPPDEQMVATIRHIMRERSNGSSHVWAEHLSSARERPERPTMTSTEFRAKLNATKLTIREFAYLVDLSEVTVAMWGQERHERGLQGVPPWVPLLLTAWSAYPDLLETARRATS
jgi:hypothetical protein